MSMHHFLLGILADEAFRRLVVPFFRRHPEHVARMKNLARFRRASKIAGVGLVGSELDGIDTSGMHYMDREGPGEIDGGTPPAVDGADSGLPFMDISGFLPPQLQQFGAGLAAKVRDKAIARAQDQAAEAIVSQFADEALSGCLGAVDDGCRAAMRKHLEWHRQRGELAGADLVGWGLPSLSSLAKVKRFADKLSPSAFLKRKLMNRAIGKKGGGRAPGPQPDGAPAEPAPEPEPEAEYMPPEEAAMEGIYALQSPTNQLVHTLAGLPPALRPLALAHMRRRRRGRVPPGGAWRGAPPAVTGWGMPFLRSAGRAAGRVASNPVGKLLISAVPGGATALAARDIANKALRSGDLNPAHLKAAGDLTKRGAAGDQAALMKIAQVKQRAGRGDRNAEVALDRIKLAHCIQSGKACPPGRGRMRAHYNAGVATIRRR